MLRLAFDFIITWRETRTRPNAYWSTALVNLPRPWRVLSTGVTRYYHGCDEYSPRPWQINNIGIPTEQYLPDNRCIAGV